MPLALSLSPHPDLYRNGSEWAVGNSNFAKLIHFLKNAQFFMLFFFRILCMFYSIRLRADTKLMLISGLCKSEVGPNRFREDIFLRIFSCSLRSQHYRPLRKRINHSKAQRAR